MWEDYLKDYWRVTPSGPKWPNQDTRTVSEFLGVIPKDQLVILEFQDEEHCVEFKGTRDKVTALLAEQSYVRRMTDTAIRFQCQLKRKPELYSGPDNEKCRSLEEAVCLLASSGDVQVTIREEEESGEQATECECQDSE